METSAYHDEIWRQVPEGREPSDWELRRGFCLSLARAGEAVLDLGCGDGAMLAELGRAGVRAVGADVSRVALERAGRRGEFELHAVPADGSLPFEDEAFDGVWASEVLGQAVDTGGLLSEARRVLRPDGWIGVTTPFHGWLKNVAVALTGFERAHHPEQTTLRRYTARSLRDQLRDRGFERVEVRGAGGLPGFRSLLLARAVRGPAEG